MKPPTMVTNIFNLNACESLCSQLASASSFVHAVHILCLLTKIMCTNFPCSRPILSTNKYTATSTTLLVISFYRFQSNVHLDRNARRVSALHRQTVDINDLLSKNILPRLESTFLRNLLDETKNLNENIFKQVSIMTILMTK